MAKDKNKQPGRLKQLWTVYKATAKSDPNAAWLAILVLLLVLGAFIGIGFLTNGSDPWNVGLWSFTGLLTGVLGAMITMTRRAEQAAFKQIEGQPGAVGAVLDSAMRRSWRAKSMPVAVDPKSKNAVYRAIGKPGVVLIAEGDSAKVRQMLDDEAKKVARVAPGVTIHKIRVGTDQHAVRLHLLTKSLYKLPKALNRSEVTAVVSRLESLGSGPAIPKGIDPLKFRAPKRKV